MTTTNGRRTQPDAAAGTSPSEPGRPPCECGCGGFPKGKSSRFIPGHDAKLHSAQKKAAAGAAPSPSVPVNAQDRPRRPSRRSAGKDGPSRVDGSDA
jgi:hypothetical protein